MTTSDDMKDPSMTTPQTAEPDAPFDPEVPKRVAAFAAALAQRQPGRYRIADTFERGPDGERIQRELTVGDLTQLVARDAFAEKTGLELAEKCQRYREACEELRAQLALHAGEPPEIEAVHLFFGLSYASYLVLPRVLLQSMPDWWQTAFVRLVEQFYDAFQHVEKPEAYDVVPGRVEEVLSLTDAERELLGITVEDPEENEDGEYVDPDATTQYYNKNGDELDYDSRVVVPMRDPLPPYNRGRTVIPPRFSAEADADDGVKKSGA